MAGGKFPDEPMPQQLVPRGIEEPLPPSVELEPLDSRLEKGTLVAELARAVRAGLEPGVAEPAVREIEAALTVPGDWQSAKCPGAEGCPLWAIPRPHKREPPGFEERMALFALVAPVVRAAFDEARAATLLRELRRFPTTPGQGSCPHCKTHLSFHRLPPPAAEPGEK